MDLSVEAGKENEVLQSVRELIKDNILKVGGHRVNPQEIEDVLIATGLIIEAVVVGLPDRLLGHKLVAAATPKNGDCSEKEIMALCSEKLPHFKIPETIKLVRALPKKASGKISREKCLELF